MSTTPRPTLSPIGKLLFLLIFAVSYPQWPLYSSNQNTYFIHGLANAGVGLLQHDWLAHTADPFPAFSALVTLTKQLLREEGFYLQYMILLAVYAYGLVGIACHVSGVGATRTRYLSYLAILLLLYSGLLFRLVMAVTGSEQLSSIVGPTGPLISGVAMQYVVGSSFQPSAFGVFIVLSISFFLRDRPLVAVGCLALAAAFHSTYLLTAAVLAGTYVVVLVNDKDYRRAILVGAVAVALTTPVAISTYLAFRPTSPDTATQAQSILADHRLPHHAVVSAWFGRTTAAQMCLVALALFLVRRTRLFPLLLIPSVVAIVLTACQVATGSKSLALLFPWRLSVFLVPIATAVILAHAVSGFSRLIAQPRSMTLRLGQAAIVAVMVVVGYVGARQTVGLIRSPRVGRNALASFVAGTSQPGRLYLVPPDLEAFRLAAGVPVFVDRKSHPYKDTEVIEWFNRAALARSVYSSNVDAACATLQEMSARYGITHVVTRADSPLSGCEILNESYRDAEYALYRVQKR